MREYWLTNENNKKWSLATFSGTPFTNVKNPSANIKYSYWEGNRSFQRTNQRDEMTTISGIVWCLDGDFVASDFLSYTTKSKKLFLWIKRDGIDERYCRVDFHLDSRGETNGRSVPLNVTFNRLSPWMSKTRSYLALSEEVYVRHKVFEFQNYSNRESPFVLSLTFYPYGNQNIPSKIIVCDRELTKNTDGDYYVSDSETKCISFVPSKYTFSLQLSTLEGEQKILLDGDDAYNTIDFSKDAFFQLDPGQDKLHIYINVSDSENWHISGSLLFFDQFLEG